MTRTVLVLSSGDGTGLNFTRCLRMAGGWRTVGVDGSLADFHCSEADERHLMTGADEDELMRCLVRLVERYRPDLVYAADTSWLLDVVSRRRAEIGAALLLPDYDDHVRMEDKWSTWLALAAAGLATPPTELVDGLDALRRMVDRYGRVWLRRRSGSAGAGSVATDSADFARAWVERENGWGHFTVAQCLTSRTATFSGLWHDGALVASQLRERLGWQYPSLSASGVTGITGAQRTIWDPALHEQAVSCVFALASRPHGIVGVDFTYDADGRALPTEVQPARFYSSMQFLAEVGLNFPALYCQVALDGPPGQRPLVNPIRTEHYWVKNVDRLPRLLTADEYFVAK